MHNEDWDQFKLRGHLKYDFLIDEAVLQEERACFITTIRFYVKNDSTESQDNQHSNFTLAS